MATTKKLNEATTVTTVTTSQYIPLTDTNGNVTKVSLENLKASLLAGIDLNAINDGVFIMCHQNSDNNAHMVNPRKWTFYQNKGEIAEGVVVVESGKILVVAPTDTKLTWSSAAVSGGGTTTTNRLTALNDWNGKTNTASQITHSECATESYAPGYCAAYERVNANGKGLTAGSWWLPSMGEMMMIYANKTKINYALSLINGATPLAEVIHWTSTEESATGAWLMDIKNGYVNVWNTKPTSQHRVRAVSTY